MVHEIAKLTAAAFPPLLLEINDPPTALFLRGMLSPNDHRLLSVVGSRKPTPYGIAACRHLIEGLRGYPISIVSGLALGIDGIAHNAALSVGLHAIAIPGSGIDEASLYPSSHKPLAKRILAEGGALLSEYEPGFTATTWSFPKRNRIMAGIAHATLIIEASERSGTLITARLAMEYNREVLAVPGPIDSDRSMGPNRLIKDGATPVHASEDILEALGIAQMERQAVVRASPEEERVIVYLRVPHARDDLIRDLSLNPKDAAVLLSRMELSGKIFEFGGMLRLR